jgi:hypothetical protein
VIGLETVVMTDPFKTDDAAQPTEISARRFAYSVMKTLETAETIDAGTHIMIRMPGGFAIIKKEEERS